MVGWGWGVGHQGEIESYIVVGFPHILQGHFSGTMTNIVREATLENIGK